MCLSTKNELYRSRFSKISELQTDRQTDRQTDKEMRLKTLPFADSNDHLQHVDITQPS